MTDDQRETAVLKQVIPGATTEGPQFEERTLQVRNDERCARRAASLMLLSVALSIAGICYSAILQPEHPRTVSQLFTPFLSKVFFVLGLGSLICLGSFAVLAVFYRKKMNQRLGGKVLD